MALRVRQAILEDAQAITDIYRSLVPRWMQTDAEGQAIESEYSRLNLYERWGHGGPWMSIETCAVWLAHLLQRQDSIPLVAELDGIVIGQAEVFISQEAPPYGHHINISTLCIRAEMQQTEIGTALVQYIEEMARVLGCSQVTVAYAEPSAFFESVGYLPTHTRHNILLSAEEGRVFYRALELSDNNPTQIDGWYMPLGRYQNAREEWERMYWPIWNSVPQLVEAKWHKLYIDLTGQPGILHLHQHDDDPSIATARLWTKNPLSTHILSAMRDRAARLGYKRVRTLVDSANLPIMGEVLSESNAGTLYSKTTKA